MPSAKINEATRREWRELGFFYDRGDRAKEWRIAGSKGNLGRFAKILRDYAADARNEVTSKHEHYGPYNSVFHNDARAQSTGTSTHKKYMKRTSSFFAFLLVSASACSASVADNIVGAYMLEIGKPGNSLEIILECKEETECTFTSISKAEKSPFKEVQILKNVRPVDNLTYASNALKYAIDHQTQSPRFPDAIESMSRLRPVLSTNPSISRC
ncbi:MAG TPA: hypothetical protein VJ577_02365 [Burkholderiaceae bacterium]|nr:hypothetical protein [Burkholderiaceae bacterium]